MAEQPATIFALSSAAGRAAIAVVRVSGSGAADTVLALTGRPTPKPRYAAFRQLKDPASGEALDDGVVLWFPAPASETGENIAEFQIHGGRAAIAGVIAALGQVPGCRLAEPGEFTRRAFDNGKLDLTAVEGLADLIDAETEAQRRQALRQLRGDLGRVYDSWRDELVRILAHLEAFIDFPEETDREAEGREREGISRILAAISQHVGDSRRGERLRDGFSVAIVGAPNVGKSSLLNAIARRDVAIVSDRAGTTRDVVEVHLDLAGYPVTLADTAGIRESRDEIEREGVRRAQLRAEEADCVVVVVDALSWPTIPGDLARFVGGGGVVVANKIDLLPPGPGLPAGPVKGIGVSALRGQGIDCLIDEIRTRAIDQMGLSAGPSVTRPRHRRALENCADALRRSLGAELPELAAEDVRLAVRELGRITGRVEVEDILDVVFRDFCIGK